MMVSRDGYPKGSGKRICHNQFFDLKRQGSIKDKTSFYLTSTATLYFSPFLDQCIHFRGDDDRPNITKLNKNSLAQNS